MALPYEPQSIEQLKSRFSKCLEKVWDKDIDDLDKERPGLLRDYVFDFENGLRLIISKDNYKELGGLHIHISCSANKSDTFNHCFNKNHLNRFIQACYNSIGGKGNLEFIGFTEGRVPHWKIPLRN